jgi:hypothetical protein
MVFMCLTHAETVARFNAVSRVARNAPKSASVLRYGAKEYQFAKAEEAANPWI